MMRTEIFVIQIETSDAHAHNPTEKLPALNPWLQAHWRFLEGGLARLTHKFRFQASARL